MSKSESFKPASVSVTGCGPFVVLVNDDRAVALSALNEPAEQCGRPLVGARILPELLKDWDCNIDALKSVLGSLADQKIQKALPFAPRVPLRVHASVPASSQVVCTSANFRKYIIDYIVDSCGGSKTGPLVKVERRKAGAKLMGERAATGTPYTGVKAGSAANGPYDAVVLLADITLPDWELEIAVIFGKAGRNLTRDNALSIVASYAVANDISARDLIVWRDLKVLGTDWPFGKSGSGFLPPGPFLVPAEFVNDSYDLRTRLKLNGEPMHGERSNYLIFDISRQIEYLSRQVQILPSDVLLTGSPAGNGIHHNRFLRDGDVTETFITGRGTQRIPVSANGA